LAGKEQRGFPAREGDIEMATRIKDAMETPIRAPARRVLVVDDDRDNRELLVELLASEGYLVSSASDGRRALAEARAKRPDVILLDLMMPVMNGWEFRDAQLRDPDLARVPVVVVSAFEDTLDVEAILKKPYLLEDVLDTVQRLAA
jgi:CheY-like chemotaxis protein